MIVNPSDPDVMILSEAGTSVLVLENVRMDREGLYHCEVALMERGNPIVSENGVLIFNGEFCFNPYYTARITCSVRTPCVCVCVCPNNYMF